MKVITVDGQSGVGKGTLCKSLAKKLGYAYLDTGSLYRVVMLKLILEGKGFEKETAIKAANDLTPSEIVKLLKKPDIRENPEVARLIPITIAKVQEVRNRLVEIGKEFAQDPPLLDDGTKPKGVILDGRECGTMTAPDADHKFYLTARAEVKAQRRFEDYKQRGKEQPFEKVLADVIARDETDEKNPMIPKPGPDTIHIDSSDLNKEEVLEKVLSYL